MRVCRACVTETEGDAEFCPACGAVVVDAPVADSVAVTATRDASLIGSKIDGFQIDSVLGGGAFGTVYRGRQLGLDRPVAIKVPTHEIAIDPVMAKRFAREAKSAARVTHPGVVAIYAVGELADGRPYLAMQLIDGEPLDRILAAGPIPAVRALRIARLIASALSETHAAQVVHRDLKPTNIVWRRDRNGDDRITLVDFGIAVCRPGNADATRLTSGGLIGTPHYMSPEQAHGEHVDGRADLYALGCVLFELVTGAPPFDGSGFEVLLAHLGRPAPTPSEREPSVPEVVDHLILDLLAKRPDDRPQTADAVVTRIDEALAVLEGRPAPELPRRRARVKRVTSQPTTRERPMPAAARPRWLGLGILAALAAAGVIAIQLSRAPDDDATTVDHASTAVGRRTVITDDGEMAARATLYDPIVAGAHVTTVVEVWNALGGPLEVPHLVVTIEGPDGVATGVAATPEAKGRYVFAHVFEAPGPHILRVFPPEAASVFTIELDVQ